MARPLRPPLHPALALGAVALLIAAPLLFALIGTPNGQSYSFNMAWTVAFGAADGLYPRYLPELAFGLGGADFYFYGPFPFWVMSWITPVLCPGCSPQTAFALAEGMIWAAGALAFWGFARRFVPDGPAILAAIVYSVLPYHLGMDWMTRQAAGEFAAYAFVPLLASGMHTALRDGRVGAAFPLGLAGLMTCHLPTALLAVHVFALIFAIWAVSAPKAAPAALLRLAVMGTAGAALAAVYWLPAIVLLDTVTPQILYSDPGLDPLAWLYGGAGGIVPQGRIGLLNLASLSGALVLAVLATWAASRRVEAATWILAPVLLCLLLNLAPAGPLWEHWVISRVQFPFRLLVFTDLAAALAVGVLLARASEGRGAARITGFAGVAIAGLLILVQLPQLANRLPSALETKGRPVRMVSAPEYFPAPFGHKLQAEAEARGLDVWRYHLVVEDWAAQFAADPAILAPEAIAPGQWRVTTAPGPVRLALPWWQLMTATDATGAAVTLSPDPEFGLVSFTAPDGAGPVSIRIVRHTSETLGYVLSGLGLLGTLALAGQGRPASYPPERNHVAS